MNMFHYLTISMFFVALATSQQTSASLVYPTSLAENNVLTEAARVALEEGHANGGDTVTIVANALKNKVGTDLEPNQRALVEQYVSLADVKEDNCNIYYAADLAFLLKFHQHEIESQLYKYLEAVTGRQLQVCLPIWDTQLAQAVEALGVYKRDMQGLLDYMMTIKFREMTEQPYRPYNREDLHFLSSSPIEKAALLNTIVTLGQIQVDENFKNHQISFEQFRQAYTNTVLVLCSNVCNNLKASIDVYQEAFDPYIEDSSNPLRDEWTASNKICCSIVDSNQKGMAQYGRDPLIEATYQELVSRPETIYEEAPEQISGFEILMGGIGLADTAVTAYEELHESDDSSDDE